MQEILGCYLDEAFLLLFTTFIQRNNETMASHMKPFGTLDPGLKMWEHLRFRYCK
jgi:hypothetical protein